MSETEQGIQPRRSGAWTAAGAVASGITAAALTAAVVIAVRAIKEAREAREQQAQAIAGIRDELRAQQASTFVGLKATPHTCVANNSDTICTVTNPTQAPINTCFRGTLTQKKARGVHLTSMVGCTGRLAPHETRTVAVPWSGGFARDVCASTNRFGTDMLDWDVCDFMEEAVDADALERLAQGAPAATPK